jgi:hypothetical protein
MEPRLICIVENWGKSIVLSLVHPLELHYWRNPRTFISTESTSIFTSTDLCIKIVIPVLVFILWKDYVIFIVEESE